MFRTTKLWHILLRTFETLVAFIVVMISLLFYLLHDSPLDAHFLLPHIEGSLLPKEDGYHLHVDSVMMGSDLQKEGLIQVEIKNLKLLRADDSVLLSVPQARFAYDFWHLLTMNAVPSTILVQKPSMTLVLTDKGEVMIREAEKSVLIEDKTLKHLIAQILSLKHIDVHDASLRLQDLKTNNDFIFSKINLKLSRRFHMHERISFDSDLTYSGQTTRVLFNGSMNRLTKNLDFQSGVSSVYLQPLGRFIPLLDGFDFPVQLSMRGRVNLKSYKKGLVPIIDKINFQMKSLSGGILNLPAPLTNEYQISELQINGMLTQQAKLLKTDQSYFKLTSGTVAHLSSQTTGLDEYLQTGDATKLNTEFRANILDIPTDQLAQVWPSSVGTSTHNWVAHHISQGMIPHADFVLKITGNELTDVFGDIQATGLRVDYLPPMPPVEDVQARLYLYSDKMNIDILGGHSGLLNVAGSQLFFTDIDIDPSWADIRLKVVGPVREMLALLDSKPLELIQSYGVDISQSFGEATLNTQLYFELDTQNSPDKVQVQTQGEIQNAQLVFHDLPFQMTQANLSLELSNDQMTVAGQTNIFDIPFKVKWLEYFNKNKHSEYEVSGLFDTQLLTPVYSNISKFISGPIHLSGSLYKKSDTLDGQIQLNLTNALVNLYPLGQKKERGKDLLLNAYLSQTASKTYQLDIDLTGCMTGLTNDLKVQGRLEFGTNVNVDFPIIESSENHLQVSYSKTKQDIKFKMLGSVWNATEILKMPFDFIPDTPANQDVCNIDLDIRMNQVIFNPKIPIYNLSVAGHRQQTQWEHFHAQADMSEPFILIYDASDHQFKGAYHDFGNLMKAFNLTQSMMQGSMTLTADVTSAGDIIGEILIQNLKLQDPGFLTQAFSILGIMDAFMGNDLVFDEVRIPLTLDIRNNVRIEQGYAAGTNLGVTFSGEWNDNLLNIKGALVPAYAVNSLPGKIPLLGWFFKNSEGGGVLSLPFTVSGTLADHKIEMNPLGTVKAGFLGNLF